MSVSVKLPLLSFLFLFALETRAQIYVFSGVHQNYVRNHVLSNESELTSWHIGAGAHFRLSEARRKLVFNAECATIRKGYRQILGGDESNFHFDYFTFQGTVGYQLFPFVSVKGGLNLAMLVNANLKRWYQTYKDVDLGLVGGLDFLENKRFGFYVRVVYGLTPMIKYDNIDAMGNFNGTIRDMKNTSFMAGVSIKLYEREFFIRH